MDFSQKERNPAKKYGGLAVVIILHVFVIYALVSGLARTAGHLVAPELIAEIVEPVKPPPPPDLPPPPPPPKVLAPPPPFIPPPEVQVNVPPPPNTIAAVSNVQPDVPVFTRPAPPVPTAVEAPPAAPPAGPPVVVAGINDLNSCKPEYPRAATIAEETGVTKVEFTVGPDGQLQGEPRVKKSSGSRSLDRAAVTGLAKCKFNPGTQDGKPVQSKFVVDYVWKLDN